MPALTSSPDGSDVRDHITTFLWLWVDDIRELSNQDDATPEEEGNRRAIWNAFFGGLHRALYANRDALLLRPNLATLGGRFTIIYCQVTGQHLSPAGMDNVWDRVIADPTPWVAPWSTDLIVELALATGTQGRDSILKKIEKIACHLSGESKEQGWEDTVPKKHHCLFLQFAAKFLRAHDENRGSH